MSDEQCYLHYAGTHVSSFACKAGGLGIRVYHIIIGQHHESITAEACEAQLLTPLAERIAVWHALHCRASLL